MKDALTLKQSRFVEEYLVDCNGTQAAIRAGYSQKTADVQASRLLSLAKVASAVQEGRNALAVKAELKAQDVIDELKKIGFANMMDFMRVTSAGDPFVDLSKLTRDHAAALAECTVEDFTDGRGDEAREVRRVKIKLHDKLAGLDKLGRHLGLWKDTHDRPQSPLESATTDFLVAMVARLRAHQPKGLPHDHA